MSDSNHDVAATEATIKANIDSITTENGYNVLIVCCSSEQQAGYWQSRLEDGRGSLLPSSALVLAVSEDWEGGAGNALGTLFAFQNAAALAKSRNGVDLEAMVREGKCSIGMYHTAGKGTRLAPLPGAENNNKPGVKVPLSVMVGSELVPMTILEAVIKQTSSYAASRPGRLSVFWGDQVFIPTVPVEYTVSHHVDILCSLGPMPSEEVWKEKGMDKYGLIAQSMSGEAAQVEKVSHETANEMLAGLGSITSVGVSLGSFSVSGTMLFALLSEFSTELAAKQGKLDSDPHLWMPMTLPKEAYIKLMQAKDMTAEQSGAHFDRMASFLERFKDNLAGVGSGSLGLFGPVDVGQGVYWWDYGQLKLYQRNALLLAEETSEASLMRRFFGFSDDKESRVVNTDTSRVNVDSSSCISNCNLGAAGDSNCGSVRGSVLCNVNCKYIEAEGCILINVTAERICAKPGSIIYNVVDTHGERGLSMTEGQVITGVMSSDGSQLIMNSSMSTDGGNVWKAVVAGNSKSFEDVYKSNSSADPLSLEKVIKEAHGAKWSSIVAKDTTVEKKIDETMSEMSGVDRILSVAGNRVCVDCAVANPDWASINLGILMCVDCAGVHRSLGTHITQVRSLTLDVECWQGELLEFMCSVGNACFNASWEASASKGVRRPQTNPGNAFLRKYFITRKYQVKAFMFETTKTNELQVTTLKSNEVRKLGGKDSSMFHKWQARQLTLTSDGKLYYSKSGTTISESQGIIYLNSPGQPQPDFEYGSKKDSKGFTFSLPTSEKGEHAGRTFHFSCGDEVDCIDWIEAISAMTPSRLVPKANRVMSPLETEVASLVREFQADNISTIVKQGSLLQKLGNGWTNR